jgi:hypothetical protein
MFFQPASTGGPKADWLLLEAVHQESTTHQRRPNHDDQYEYKCRHTVSYTSANGLELDFVHSPISTSDHDLASPRADLRIYFPSNYTYDHNGRYEVSLSHVKPKRVAHIPDLQLRKLCEDLSQQTFRFTLRNEAQALITGREIRGWVIKVSLWDSAPLNGAALLALSMFVQGSEEQGARVVLACKETVADDLLPYGVAPFMYEDEALNGWNCATLPAQGPVP